MTYEEARQRLNKRICNEGANRADKTYHICTDECLYGKDKCEIAMAMEALEKQIPKKPVNNLNFAKMSGFDGWLECPTCNKSVNGTHFPFCPWCGQHLDWSECDAERH